jgi:hypothetical protein
MAEDVEHATKGGANFLMHKLGPLPVVVWIGAFAAIWWYLQKRNTATSKTGANQQVDPAGNVGSIDPASGYVYGTPEDNAALAANNSSGGTTSGTGGSTVAGQYADNTAWSVAAINYLVGIGIDPTSANSAITQFLASQPLTTQQQADVNQAIQRLGAPPSPPQPGTAPTPIVSPPAPGVVYATNPPTGLAISSKASTSIGLKWNSSTNASGYTVRWGTTSAAGDGSTTVAGTNLSTTISGLQAGKLYYIQVQATPAKAGDGFASTTATTTAAASSSTPPPASKPPTSAPKAKPPREHRVISGETFTSIAAHYGYKPGGIALYNYQLNGSPHSAAAKAEIKQRGPNKLVVNELVYIPV